MPDSIPPQEKPFSWDVASLGPLAAQFVRNVEGEARGTERPSVERIPAMLGAMIGAAALAIDALDVESRNLREAARERIEKLEARVAALERK